MFRPSNGHLQGVQLIDFHNKMRTRCKIQFTEQRVLCSKHSVTRYQLFCHVLAHFWRVSHSCLLSLCFCDKKRSSWLIRKLTAISNAFWQRLSVPLIAMLMDLGFRWYVLHILFNQISALFYVSFPWRFYTSYLYGISRLDHNTRCSINWILHLVHILLIWLWKCIGRTPWKRPSERPKYVGVTKWFEYYECELVAFFKYKIEISEQGKKIPVQPSILPERSIIQEHTRISHDKNQSAHPPTTT
jgi:hypothetical protein